MTPHDFSLFPWLRTHWKVKDLKIINIETECDTATERSQNRFWGTSSSGRATGMSIQIKGAYFKVDLAYHQDKFCVVSFTASVWVHFNQAWLPTSTLCTYVKTTMNVHKICCRQCENLFVSGFDVNMLQGRTLENCSDFRLANHWIPCQPLQFIISMPSPDSIRVNIIGCRDTN